MEKPEPAAVPARTMVEEPVVAAAPAARQEVSPKPVRKVEEPAILRKVDAEAGLRSLDAASPMKVTAEAPPPAPVAKARVETKVEKEAERAKAEAPAREPKVEAAAAASKKSISNNHASKDKKKPVDIAPAEEKGAARAAAFEAPVLGMGPSPKGGIPLVAKILVAVVAVGGGGYLLLQPQGKSSGGSAASPAKSMTKSKANRVFVPMSGVGGWSSNWSGDPAKSGGRTISMFRPSLQQADYRIEFEGQIEAKGFGWVFRAKDAQNYYGYRVEVVKPGLQPLVALVRIAVYEGNEAQKHYALLEKPMRPDTVYRIRMDAVGSEFSTWINDQLIEIWQDDRLEAGGVGLFTEKEDRANIRKVQILEMR